MTTLQHDPTSDPSTSIAAIPPMSFSGAANVPRGHRAVVLAIGIAGSALLAATVALAIAPSDDPLLVDLESDAAVMDPTVPAWVYHPSDAALMDPTVPARVYPRSSDAPYMDPTVPVDGS